MGYPPRARTIFYRRKVIERNDTRCEAYNLQTWNNMADLRQLEYVPERSEAELVPLHVVLIGFSLLTTLPSVVPHSYIIGTCDECFRSIRPFHTSSLSVFCMCIRLIVFRCACDLGSFFHRDRVFFFHLTCSADLDGLNNARTWSTYQFTRRYATRNPGDVHSCVKRYMSMSGITPKRRVSVRKPARRLYLPVGMSTVGPS